MISFFPERHDLSYLPDDLACTRKSNSLHLNVILVLKKSSEIENRKCAGSSTHHSPEEELLIVNRICFWRKHVLPMALIGIWIMELWRGHGCTRQIRTVIRFTRMNERGTTESNISKEMLQHC